MAVNVEKIGMSAAFLTTAVLFGKVKKCLYDSPLSGLAFVSDR